MTTIYKREIPSSIARAVYDGRERLGSVKLQNGKVAAYDRLGRELGRFDTELAAIAAITEQAEGVA